MDLAEEKGEGQITTAVGKVSYHDTSLTTLIIWLQSKAEKKDVPYFEVSAKTGEGCEELLNRIIEDLFMSVTISQHLCSIR